MKTESKLQEVANLLDEKMNELKDLLKSLGDDSNRAYDKIDNAVGNFKLESVVRSVLPNDVKVNFCYGSDPFIHIHLKDDQAEWFKKIMDLFPCTNTKTEIAFAGKTNYFIDTPYMLDIKNPAKVGFSIRYEVGVKWQTDGFGVWVSLPIIWCEQFVSPYSRGITSSEYHYFTGVSQKKLSEMTVRAYNWRGTQENYYGGSKKLVDTDLVNRVINHLRNLK